MKNHTQASGHAMAVVSILIWGTTFIASKILLESFTPVELLFFRFVIGLAVLWLMKPRKLTLKNRKEEWYFAGAGLTGICLYYLFENIALTYTQASNVGVITSISPFFIGINAHIFLKDEKLKSSFFVGFVCAIIGISLISFSGQEEIRLNLKGDLLSVAAAFMWGLYSILSRKISECGYSVIQSTRRMFTYGVLFMIPMVCMSDFTLGAERFCNPVSLLNLLYLGVGACAVCFVTWNYAVEVLGAIKTSVYIYVIPVITILTSVIILHERLTVMSVAGTVLTLAGLGISEYTGRKTAAA